MGCYCTEVRSLKKYMCSVVLRFSNVTKVEVQVCYLRLINYLLYLTVIDFIICYVEITAT